MEEPHTLAFSSFKNNKTNKYLSNMVLCLCLDYTTTPLCLVKSYPPFITSLSVTLLNPALMSTYGILPMDHMKQSVIAHDNMSF